MNETIIEATIQLAKSSLDSMVISGIASHTDILDMVDVIEKLYDFGKLVLPDAK